MNHNLTYPTRENPKKCADIWSQHYKSNSGRDRHSKPKYKPWYQLDNRMPLRSKVWRDGESSRHARNKLVNSPIRRPNQERRNLPLRLPRREDISQPYIPTSRGIYPEVQQQPIWQQENYDAESELSDIGSTPVMEDRLFYPSTRGQNKVAPTETYLHREGTSSRCEPTYHIQQGLENMTLRHMNTPFCEAMMNTPKEPKVKTPTIEAYDDTLILICT